MELQSSSFINGQHIDTFEEIICDTPLISFHNRHSDSNSVKLKSSHKKGSGWQNDNICNAFDSLHQPLSSSSNLDFCSSSVLSFDAYGNLTSDENDARTSFKHEVPSLAEFDFILSSFEGKLGKNDKSPNISLSSSKQKRGRKQKSTFDNDKSLSTSDINFHQVFKEEFDSSCSLISRYGRTRKQKKSEDGFVFGTINFNELRKANSSKKRHSLPQCKNNVKKGKSNNLSDISKTFSTSSLLHSGYSSEDDFLPLNKIKKSKRVKKYSVDIPINFESSCNGTAEISQIERETASNKGKAKCRNLKGNKEKSESRKNSNCESFKGENLIKQETDTNERKVKLKSSKGSAEKSQIIRNNSTSEKKRKLNLNCAKPVVEDTCSSDITVVFDSLNDDKEKKCEIGTIQEDINIIKSSIGLSVPTGRFSPLEELPNIILEESNSQDSLVDLSKIKNKPLIEPFNIKTEPLSPEIVKQKTISGGNTEIIKIETLQDEFKVDEYMTTKFGRQIRKPIFIDLTHEKRSSSVKTKSLQDNNNVVSFI